MLAELGWWVALGLANLANILDPEAFVVGGGLATLGDLLFDPIRAAFATLLEGAAFRPPDPDRPRQPGPPGRGHRRRLPGRRIRGPRHVDPLLTMRVGITLPLFNDDPELAVAVARRAEDAGLDGVFVFDHLWPLRQPHRPALHSTTVLAAVAAETSRIHVGTLVARVGLVPDAVLVHNLVTLAAIAGDRLIAGLGTGDSANKDENLAYGIDFAPGPCGGPA